MSNVKNVLFLSTKNSARSIMAEAILNDLGMNKGRFRAFSAGTEASGLVDQFALEQLANFHLPTKGLRSKSWAEFAGPEAPKIDFVFTLCDRAADEVCPVWLGEPMLAYWGIPDPAVVEGSDFVRHGAYVDAFRQLRTRIELLVSLPLEKFDLQALKGRLEEIGRT